MTIDPRLADRRKEVAEDRARRNIRRLLRLLVVVAFFGALVWLFLSPTLSARTLDVSGVHSSETREILAGHQVAAGRPLILVRAASVEASLLEDPWVKEAEVDLDWPDRVVVTVAERTPRAWVETSGGWQRRAVDGVALPGPDQPDDTMAHLVFPEESPTSATTSQTVLGSLEFVEALPVTLSSNALIEVRAGELWAVVGGFDVRLGRPVEMREKALTLASLLQEDLEPGSVLNLIAPTNPAVVHPETPDTTEDTSPEGGSDDG